jgi:hypothetical protein
LRHFNNCRHETLNLQSRSPEKRITHAPVGYDRYKINLRKISSSIHRLLRHFLHMPSTSLPYVSFLTKSYKSSSRFNYCHSPSLMAILLVRANECRSEWHTEQFGIVEIAIIVWLIHALHPSSWANMWAMNLYHYQNLYYCTSTRIRKRESHIGSHKCENDMNRSTDNIVGPNLIVTSECLLREC